MGRGGRSGTSTSVGAVDQAARGRLADLENDPRSPLDLHSHVSSVRYSGQDSRSLRSEGGSDTGWYALYAGRPVRGPGSKHESWLGLRSDSVDTRQHHRYTGGVGGEHAGLPLGFAHLDLHRAAYCARMGLAPEAAARCGGWRGGGLARRGRSCTVQYPGR